jgi:hypothetical protein
MRIAILAALFIAATPLAAQKVEVGEGDWSDIPRLQTKGWQGLTERQMTRLEILSQENNCPSIGRRGRVNLEIPFLVKVQQGKPVEHLIVRRIGCPDVEAVVAGVALTMVKGGLLLPTGENQRNWYRSEVRYSVN